MFKNVRYNTINDKNKYKSKDHLFMFKTTIMVNKRKKNLLYNSDKRQSSFFIFLILTLSFYYFLLFPKLFRFNFVVSERNVNILFCRHIWGELSLLFWTFLSGTFFPAGGGGGGARAPSAPPCVRACINPSQKAYSLLMT